MISDIDRNKLHRFATECADGLGARMSAVLLYGDAAGAVSGAPLATVVLVDTITTAVLDIVAAVSRRWRRSNIATPLVLDDEYLTTSCDVFPLELLVLMDAHELIWGNRDPLATLVLDHEYLRLEVEQQLKGKLLHLRQAYLETDGDRHRLRTLMLDSSEGFEAIMHGLLMLAGQGRGKDGVAISREVELVLGTRLDTFRSVQSARRDGGLAPGEAHLVFEKYLEELVALTRVAGRITRP